MLLRPLTNTARLVCIRVCTSTDVAASPTDSLTVRDNRTGQEYDIPITDGTIHAKDLGQIRTSEEPT